MSPSTPRSSKRRSRPPWSCPARPSRQAGPRAGPQRSELARIAAANPFPEQALNATVAILLDEIPPSDALAPASQQKDGRLALSEREIYVDYGAGMADSRRRIPTGEAGTGRNMDTLTKLAAYRRAGRRAARTAGQAGAGRGGAGKMPGLRMNPPPA